MTDPTAGRLEAALDTAEETETAGRTIFLVIVWLSVAIGLIAHATDGASTSRLLAAFGVLAALAVWLHLVHQIHTWPMPSTLPQAAIMLAGVYIALSGLLLINPAYLIVLFAAFSLTFGFAPNTRWAAGLSLVVTIIWIAAWLLHDLPTGGIITPVLVWATLVALASVLDRVGAQSKERRELLAEVHATRVQLVEAERQRGVLAERERMAAEIHDTLAQGFTSIVLLSQGLGAQAGTMPEAVMRDTLALVEQTARENLSAARRLVHDLQPIELEAGSLIETLQHAGTKHETRTGVEVHVRVTGEPRDLGATHDVAVLRAIQEALTNAAKHAKATEIIIELSYAEDRVVARVADDGVGFDRKDAASEVAGVIGGQGLTLMAQRVQALAGTVTIDSTRGEGTTVTVSLPTQEPT